MTPHKSVLWLWGIAFFLLLGEKLFKEEILSLPPFLITEIFLGPYILLGFFLACGIYFTFLRKKAGLFEKIFPWIVALTESPLLILEALGGLNAKAVALKFAFAVVIIIPYLKPWLDWTLIAIPVAMFVLAILNTLNNKPKTPHV